MSMTVQDPRTPVKSRKYMPGMTLPNGKKIIRGAGRNKYHQPVYMWQCVACGGEYGPTTGTDLARTKYSKCCPPRREAKTNYAGYRDVSGWRISAIKWRAKEAGLDFDITAEYLWSLWLAQEGRCAYTGRALVLSLDRNGGTASVDRIDSSRGYVPGNVQWTHAVVNKMKWELPEGEFLAFCREITQHTKGLEK